MYNIKIIYDVLTSMPAMNASSGSTESASEALPEPLSLPCVGLSGAGWYSRLSSSCFSSSSSSSKYL